jgi:hypothetical protein
MAGALEREEEITTPEPTEGPDDAGNYTLRVDDDADDEGGEQGGQEADNLDKRGRRSWAREMKAKEKQWETERAEMTERLARLEGRASAPQPVQQSQQQPQTNEAENEVAWYQNQMDALSHAYGAEAGSKTPRQEVLDKYRQQYQQLETQRIAAIVRASTPQQQQRQQGPSVEMQMLMAETPQIYADTSLNLEAQAEAIRLARQKSGGKVTFAIAREANQRVMQRHGVGAKPAAPNANIQAKFAGTPGRAGSGGGGAGTVTLNQFERKMALGWAASHPKWANASEAAQMKAWAAKFKAGGDE